MRASILLLVSLLTASAQQSGNFFGSDLSPAAQPNPQTAVTQQMKAKSAALGGHVFRRVDGKVYNLWQTGQFVGGTVQSVEADVVILRDGTMRNRAIRNYPGEAIANSYISTYAMRNGVYTWNSSSIELYDCGVVLKPDEERQQEQVVRAQMAAEDKAKADAVVAKYNEQRDKNFRLQSNTVLHLKTLATNGEAWAQCSLGMHYLNGEGCETNRGLAIHWFKAAATNGDFEASNTLARLKVPQ